MRKFLIEVDHPEDVYNCALVIKVFLESGSHFLVNADWGCEDNIHKSWFTVEAEDREQALLIVPHQFRKYARAILLCKFSIPQIEEMLRLHKPSMS